MQATTKFPEQKPLKLHPTSTQPPPIPFQHSRIRQGQTLHSLARLELQGLQTSMRGAFCPRVPLRCPALRFRQLPGAPVAMMPLKRVGRLGDIIGVFICAWSACLVCVVVLLRVRFGNVTALGAVALLGQPSAVATDSKHLTYWVTLLECSYVLGLHALFVWWWWCCVFGVIGCYSPWCGCMHMQVAAVVAAVATEKEKI
jgi:hypothetical protein